MIDGTDIKVSWANHTNPTAWHGSVIETYRIMILAKDADGEFTDFEENVWECDGTNDDDVITNSECTWSMANITSLYNYARGETVIFSVEAKNAIGYSAESNSTGGAKAETVPDGMPMATLVVAESDSDQITIEWTAPSGDADGSVDTLAILSYEVYSDEDTYGWPLATIDPLSDPLKYVNSTVVSGDTYSYKIVAINKYGSSTVAAAAEATFTAAGAPKTPSAPVVIEDGSYLQIEWESGALA